MPKPITEYAKGEVFEALIYNGGASKHRTRQQVMVHAVIDDPWGKTDKVISVRRWDASRQAWTKGPTNSLVYPDHIIS